MLKSVYCFVARIAARFIKVATDRYAKAYMGKSVCQVWEVPYCRTDVAINFINIMQEIPPVALVDLLLIVRKDQNIILLTCMEPTFEARFKKTMDSITGITRCYIPGGPEAYLKLVALGHYNLVRRPTAEDVLRLCPQKEARNVHE